MSDDASFALLLDQLKVGSQDAFTDVFRRYSERLVRLTRGRLTPQMRQKFDPEDVMQSVFRSFFARNEKQQFEIADQDSLWALLVVMAVRKCNRRVAKLKSAKRNVAREQIRMGDQEKDQEGWEPPSRDPTPEEQMALTELICQLTEGLDQQQRTILECRLQGHTVPEISEQVGLSERTVHRNLSRLRDRAVELDLS